MDSWMDGEVYSPELRERAVRLIAELREHRRA
jgi:hypothetical protein